MLDFLQDPRTSCCLASLVVTVKEGVQMSPWLALPKPVHVMPYHTADLDVTSLAGVLSYVVSLAC